MILLLLTVLFIWAWIDAGFLAAVEVVILIGVACWIVSTAIGGIRRLTRSDDPRISLTQVNVENEQERSNAHPDPTRPQDEHPLLQHNRQVRELRKRH